MKKVKSINDVKVGMFLKYTSPIAYYNDEGIEIGEVIKVDKNNKYENIRVRLIYQTLFEDGIYTEDGYGESCFPNLRIISRKEALAWQI